MRVGSIMGVASCSAGAAISSVSVLRPLPSHKRRTLNTGRICGDPPSRGPPRSAHCLGTGRPSDVRLRFGRDVTNAAGRRGHLAVSQTEVIRDRLGHHHAYALKRRTPVRTGSSRAGCVVGVHAAGCAAFGEKSPLRHWIRPRLANRGKSRPELLLEVHRPPWFDPSRAHFY